jgi:hypothetical protein
MAGRDPAQHRERLSVALHERLLALGGIDPSPHYQETHSATVSWSGIMVNMRDDDAQDVPDEQQPAGSGDDEPTRVCDEDVPAKRAGFRLADAFDSAEMPGDRRDQFAESIARNLTPHIEAVLAQQRIAKDLARHISGFEQLQMKFLAIPSLFAAARVHQQLEESIARNLAPHLEAVLAQQRIAEDLARGISGFAQLQKHVLAIQPILDAVRVRQQLEESIARGLAPQLAAFREFARSVVPPLIKLPSLNLPTDWFPRNWENVPDLDIGAAMGIILDEGVPLVWVPRPAIVAELVSAADADARDGILLSSRDEIAVDCLTVLGEVAAPELKPLAELAAEAVSALRGGHGSSAQALAGNIFDTLLRDAARRGVMFAGPPVGYFKYDKVRKQITPVSDDTVIRRFRPDCALSAALAALENYDPSDPPPARFVRHATAHRACTAQYTPVNAIVAVMLVASMLREAQASGW